MSSFSRLTKIYMYTVYAAGLILVLHNLLSYQLNQVVQLLALCILASLALVFKVEGTTNRSHYAVSFTVYAFTFVLMGLPATIITILVSNLVVWLVEKSPWFIHLFNAACYIIVMQAGQLVFGLFSSGETITTWTEVIGIVLALGVFTILNHLMVGMIVWLARGENFAQAGTFNIHSLMLDMTLLTMGGLLAIVWTVNPFAVLLAGFPLYLLYGTLKVPALERQVEIDHKTGLYNLNYFTSQLNHELNRANRFDRPLSVIMADMDFLRTINNTYGHLAGDEILVRVAKILKSSVRDYDVVARFGGEEFSVMMPETSIATAFERAEMIRKEIENTEFEVSTSVLPLKVTMSFGIAGRERFDQEAKVILHNADLALYQAKFNGRNRVYACIGEQFIKYERENEGDSPAAGLPGPVDKASEAVVVTQPEAVAAQQPKAQQPEAEQQPKSQPPETPARAAIRREPLRSADIPVETIPRGKRNDKINVYIVTAVVAAAGLFALVYHLTPYKLTPFNLPGIIGLVVFLLLVVGSEWYSFDIYIHKNTISTSAAPLMAGTLLFGPVGALVLAIAFGLTAYFKTRSPFSRFFFNASNQVIACMAYLGLLAISGHTFLAWSPIVQLLVILGISQLVYLLNTSLVAVGVSLSLHQPVRQVWSEHYSWLSSFYLVIGFIAYAMMFGYQYAYLTGTLIMIVPLALLRYYQKQSIDRTRDMVTELRSKNAILQKSTEEISGLNQALLDTLAEAIDLRDPYLSGHSQHVTIYATQIARRMGLSERQVEVIRKASLLHDVGKLGIPEALLRKPGRLTDEEFNIVRKHPEMGALLLAKSPSLHPLIPIVRYHHEYYDGRGYPDKLKGSEIPIEARIVSVADAIEAMASDRPYRKGQSMQYIMAELARCSGTQFDPLVVDVAIKLLEATGDGLLARTLVAEEARVAADATTRINRQPAPSMPA